MPSLVQPLTQSRTQPGAMVPFLPCAAITLAFCQPLLVWILPAKHLRLLQVLPDVLSWVLVTNIGTFSTVSC